MNLMLMLACLWCQSIGAIKTDSTSVWSVLPAYSVVFHSSTEKQLRLEFGTDTLKVSGDLPMDEAADIFIREIAEKYSERIKNLKSQIDSLKSIKTKPARR